MCLVSGVRCHMPGLNFVFFLVNKYVYIYLPQLKKKKYIYIFIYIIKHKDFCPLFVCSLIFSSRSNHTTWILKQGGQESLGRIIISSIGKTKRIAFFLSARNASNLEHLPVFRAPRKSQGHSAPVRGRRTLRTIPHTQKIAWEGDKQQTD